MWWLPLLGAAAGGLGSLFGGSGWQGSNENINQDYVNNPIWQQMFGKGKGFENSSASMNALINGAMNYDPNAFWKDFMGAQGDVQGLISGPTGSVKAGMDLNLANFTKQAMADTGQELSGMGSLYSGALGSIGGQKVGAEAGKSAVELSQLQAQMYNSLWGQMLPQFSQNRQMVPQLQMQGAGLYNSQMNNMLGLGADLSSPMYQYKPGIMDSMMSGLGLGMQGMGAAGMQPKGAAGGFDMGAYLKQLFGGGSSTPFGSGSAYRG